MIYLITGQPGSGKTLWTLQHVRALTDLDGRDVYFNGIPDLRLPWKEMADGSEWCRVPDGSVVVIDEAQRAFRPRSATSKVPEHVEALETHRHRGIDIFLITQHPTLVDPNVRRLVEKHYHIKRRFGFKWASVYEFFETREHPDRSRHGGVQTEWKFPQEVFGLYKSASVHTGKVAVPRRIIFMVLAPFIVAGILYYLGTRISSKVEDGKKKGESLKKGEVVAAGGGGGVQRLSPAAYRRQFLEDREPALSGLQFTAPAYAELVKPRSIPSPSACVVMAERCTCYTEQATVLADLPSPLCRDIVARGYFEAWRESPSVVAGRERQRASQPTTATEAAAPGSVPAQAAGQGVGVSGSGVPTTQPGDVFVPQVVSAPTAPLGAPVASPGGSSVVPSVPVGRGSPGGRSH